MPRTWPYEFHDAFEDGTTASWSEGAGVEDHTHGVVHYTELARSGLTPWSGAYCWRVTLDAAGETFLDDTWAVLTGTSVSVLFRFCLGDDFAFTADDDVPLFVLAGTGDVDTFQVGLECTEATGLIRLAFGTTALDKAAGGNLRRGVWYSVECSLDLDVTFAANAARVWLGEEGNANVEVIGTTAAGDAEPGDLAVIGAELGPRGVLSTTTGTILFDEFFRKDNSARIGHTTTPFRVTKRVNKGGHLFVGPGKICDISMKSGNATIAVDQYIEVWDTDTADTTDMSRLRLKLHNSGTTSNEIINTSAPPINITKGCYVVMSPDVDADAAPDDEPSAVFQIEPRYYSRANILKLGMDRGFRSTA